VTRLEGLLPRRLCRQAHPRIEPSRRDRVPAFTMGSRPAMRREAVSGKRTPVLARQRYSNGPYAKYGSWYLQGHVAEPGGRNARRLRLKKIHDDLESGIRSCPSQTARYAAEDWLNDGLDGAPRSLFAPFSGTSPVGSLRLKVNQISLSSTNHSPLHPDHEVAMTVPVPVELP
jgi:hypothetical protein